MRRRPGDSGAPVSSRGARKGLATRRVAPRKASADVATALVGDIRKLIDEARGRAASAINIAQTVLYWQIGRRVAQEVLGGQRAEYGERVIVSLSTTLERDYGRGFAEKNVRRMIQFAAAFPETEIVATLSRQLSWSHFVLLLPVEKPLARDFYAEMCRVERWSVRALRAKIASMLYERTALSRKPEKVVRAELVGLRDAGTVTPDLVFRDPYVLDFLGLRDSYSEKDLETAIVRELGNVILEFGVGFTFVARQKRIVVDGRDYYLDLLFYHRRLRRLVAVELKLGELQAADKGQMELYLRWLTKHERLDGEDAPLGLILCAGKSEEHVELLELQRSGIRVAEYLTELPPADVLRKRLHRVVEVARARHEVAEASKAAPVVRRRR